MNCALSWYFEKSIQMRVSKTIRVVR